MQEIKDALIEAVKESCGNCIADMEDFPDDFWEIEIDKYFMPKIIPIIDGIKKQGILFKERR